MMTQAVEVANPAIRATVVLLSGAGLDAAMLANSLS